MTARSKRRVVFGEGFLFQCRHSDDGTHTVTFRMNDDTWKAAIFQGVSHRQPLRVVAEIIPAKGKKK